MSRTKGAKGKHHKEKPVKEKKKRGRPSKQHQKQQQTVNINVNSDGGGGSSHRPQIPIQIPSNIYDPSLINPHYSINDRQPTNPLTDPSIDFMAPFLQAMIANQNHNQQAIIPQQKQQPTPQPVIINQPTQPKPQPVIITQPNNPEKEPIVPQPKPEKKPAFSHKDVQHLIDEIHHKQEKEIPEPIPQNIQPEVHDNLGQTIYDKYDGIKLKNKTMPFSEVVDATAKGLLGGVAMGIAGPSLINNAASTATGLIGYQLYGDWGGVIGSLAGSHLADRYHKAAFAHTTPIEPTHPGYEPITESSYSNQRVYGGTVVQTRNIRQREPSNVEPKKQKMGILRLADAIADITPSSRIPASQKVKESKLLLDLENRQKHYRSSQNIQQANVEPQEPRPSTITQITEGARNIYRRLSGQKKGQYTQIPTSEDTDFKTTLNRSKREGQTNGTYSILSQDDPGLDFETEYNAAMNDRRTGTRNSHQSTDPAADFEAEIETMNSNRRRRSTRNSHQNEETINLMDQIVGAPNPPWTAMEQFGQQNERNIRRSIARTNQAEREQRIKDGLATPTRPPRTPKRQTAIDNFGKLIKGSSLKKKEKEHYEIIHEAEPLIKRKILNHELKNLQKEFDDILGKEAQLKTKAAQIGPLVKYHSASQIQRAMKGKMARDAVKQRTQAILTVQGAIKNKIAKNKIIKNLEDQVAKVENIVSSTRSNINEQRPEGLRKGLKKLQDRRSELVTRARAMDREQKKAEFKKLNTAIQDFDNVIIKKKTGPKSNK